MASKSSLVSLVENWLNFMTAKNMSECQVIMAYMRSPTACLYPKVISDSSDLISSLVGMGCYSRVWTYLLSAHIGSG